MSEAYSVLAVCKWRLKTLQLEQVELSAAPSARWGAHLLAFGQRMLYSGGWEVGGAVPKGKSAVLNVEEEHERRRRQDDEHCAKLDRQRWVERRCLFIVIFFVDF